MKNFVHAAVLVLGASCLTACSDGKSPEAEQAVSAEPTIAKELRDPMEKARGVSTVLQNAVEANRQEIDRQTE